ncbi:MAG: N-6 DNA methylase [Gammaproteobacteria bacterium]|nr:N-6 DNA methylase [Gammaproteobacteria bacterium]
MQHVKKIVDTYKERPDKVERYYRRVGMNEIKTNDFNLNITRM